MDKDTWEGFDERSALNRERRKGRKRGEMRWERRENGEWKTYSNGVLFHAIFLIDLYATRECYVVFKPSRIDVVMMKTYLVSPIQDSHSPFSSPEIPTSRPPITHHPRTSTRSQHDQKRRRGIHIPGSANALLIFPSSTNFFV